MRHILIALLLTACLAVSAEARVTVTDVNGGITKADTVQNFTGYDTINVTSNINQTADTIGTSGTFVSFTNRTFQTDIIRADTLYVNSTIITSGASVVGGWDTETYYNTSFDTMTSTDTYVGGDSWTVSGDTLDFIYCNFRADTGIFNNVYRRNYGSPVDVVTDSSGFHFISINGPIGTSDIEAIFRRR